MTDLNGYSSTPGAALTVAATGLPTGLPMGYRVIKAANGNVAVGRSTNVLEFTPGNYSATFITPVEPDLYLVIFDWNAGVLTPEESYTIQLVVQGIATVAQTGIGTIADYARMSLGSETWNGLVESSNIGPAAITLAVENVKARVMTNPVAQADEGTLPKPVLSYLGKLVALELLPSARAWWGTQVLSKSIGNDPAETTTYASRDHMLDALESLLLRQVGDEMALAIALMPDPVLRADNGPDIDEDDTSHYVTADPRSFPSFSEFPYHEHAPNRARWFVER